MIGPFFITVICSLAVKELTEKKYPTYSHSVNLQ